MSTLTDLYGPQDQFLEDLAVTVSSPPSPARDEFAETETLLGPSRAGSFDSGIGQVPVEAGTSAFDVATVIAQDSITANEIAAGSITVGSLSQNAENEATNGSFENLNAAAQAVDTYGASPFVGWTDDGTSQFAYNTSNPHGGGRCALLKYNGSTRTLSSELSQIIGGRKYRLSYWYRGNGGNNSAAKVQVKFVETDLNGGVVATTTGTLHTVGTTTTWVQATLTITFNAASVKGQIQALISASAVGDIGGFDDFELYPMDYDINHAAGNVLIDSTGLTINNGRLVINDVGGTEVMTASGFTGPWDDYLVSGVYNNTFQSAPLGFVTVDGTIPYWAYTRTGSSSAVKLEVQTSTGTPSNRKLVFSLTGTSGSSSDEVFLSQLVPLTPPRAANAYVGTTTIDIPWVNGNGLLTGCQTFIIGAFFKGDGVTQTGSTFENAVTGSPTSISPPRLTMRTPSDAGYIFIKFGLRRHTASTGGSTSVSLYSASVRRAAYSIEIGPQQVGDDGYYSAIGSDGTSGIVITVRAPDNLSIAAQQWYFPSTGLMSGPHGPIQPTQSGSGTLTWSAAPNSATVTVTFPYIFTNTPNVVLTLEHTVSVSLTPAIITGSISTTQFQCIGRDVAGANRTGSCIFYWVAVST